MRSALAGLLLLLCLLPASGAAQEVIRAYDSVVQVNTDGSIEVTEHITVHAEGDQIRRGIYRDFPTRYRDRFGNKVHVGFEVLGVERDGQPEPWFTENMANGVRVNTGNNDFLPVPADYTFTLRYRTTRQLGFFADHDELYWNAIGHGWFFTIERGSVEVHLPAPVPAADMTRDEYTGSSGQQFHDARSEVLAPGVVRWETTQPYGAYEGLTIVLGFPKGIVRAPSKLKQAFLFLADNRGVLIELLGLVLLLIYCVRRWHAVGRDPAPGVIIARYEPPAGYDPSGLRMMRNYSYDDRGFTADLLHLAVAGKVRIARESTGDKWRLERGEADPGTTPQGLLAGLFPDEAQTLTLEQKPAVTALLQQLKMSEQRVLLSHFEPALFHRNLGSVGKAVLIAGGTLVLSGMAGASLTWTTGLIGFAMLVVLVAFFILVRAPTPAGRRLLDHIEGFKQYLSVAERDDLARLPGPDQPPKLDAERWEQLLPYAVALDVEDAWTKKFIATVGAAAAAAAASSVSWYRGRGKDFNISSFSKDIGKGLSGSIASASTPPGSGSGRGGGGSSGGGGGGGGGGGR